MPDKNLAQDSCLMITIYRDLGFFLVSLILYTYILEKGVIYDYEAVILICITVFYAMAVCYTNRKINEIGFISTF